MNSTQFDYNLHRLLAAQNSPHLRHTALLYCGRTVTFRGLFAQTERCAKALHRWGIKPEMEVPLPHAPIPEIVCLLLALWKLGAVPQIGAHCPEASTSPLAFVCPNHGPQEVLPGIPPVLLSPALSMPLLVRRRYLKSSQQPPVLPGHILWKDFLSSGDAIPKAPQPVTSPQQKALCCCPANEKPQTATGKELYTLLRQRCENPCKEQNPCIPAAALASVDSPADLVDTLLLPLHLGLCLHLNPATSDPSTASSQPTT